MTKTLIVEDDTTLNQLLVRHLASIGLEACGVYNWVEADRYLEQNEPGLIVSDVRLPDGDLHDRLERLTESCSVIVLTAYGSIRDAVRAIKQGASEYLVKPVDPDELTLVVQRVLDHARLRADHQYCQQRLREKELRDCLLVGKSRVIEEVRQAIAAVAPTDMTVLLLGESGTGKELVARAIHEGSHRAARNFVAVDCCTLPSNLFESELFGHERGAFTGADRQKKGLIEMAEGGTLFLDEIGELEPNLQAKLLRFLETRKFRRVGGSKDIQGNVRVIAATNRDLVSMSETGVFRPDLYYRLCAFVITTPPLRDRREDIPELAEHFLRNHGYARRQNKSFTVEALRRLTAHHWPGNVRELKNAVERAVILSRDRPRIGVEDIGFLGRRDENAGLQLTFDHDPTLEEIEARYLELQLRKHAGHRGEVARVLGISERNIYRLIKRYHLDEPK